MGCRGPGRGARAGGAPVEARGAAAATGASDPSHALATPAPYAGCGKRAGAGRERVFESLRDVWRRREKPKLAYEFSEFRREGNHQRQAETAEREIGGTGGTVKAVTAGGGATGGEHCGHDRRHGRHDLAGRRSPPYR